MGVGEPPLSSIINRFHCDTSKQKALTSSGISCYRKTSEKLGQTCPQHEVGLVYVLVLGMKDAFASCESIYSDVIGSGNQ